MSFDLAVGDLLKSLGVTRVFGKDELEIRTSLFVHTEHHLSHGKALQQVTYC